MQPGVVDVSDKAEPEASELVTEVLRRIEGTNRGVDCTPEDREEIDGLIYQASVVIRCFLECHQHWQPLGSELRVQWTVFARPNGRVT